MLTDVEKETLAGLKNKFTLVVCADQIGSVQGIFCPAWKYLLPPKAQHDVFGIVNHGSGLSTVYLFDECAGTKNTDHTI